jgi:hypothetical protein
MRIGKESELHPRAKRAQLSQGIFQAFEGLSIFELKTWITVSALSLR